MADDLIAVPLPHMGVSVEEATVVAWHKAPGDEVRADEALCDIATDKVDTEVVAPSDGVLARVVAEVGETVPVGAVLCELAVGADAAARGCCGGVGVGAGRAGGGRFARAVAGARAGGRFGAERAGRGRARCGSIRAPRPSRSSPGPRVAATVARSARRSRGGSPRRMAWTSMR